MNAFGEWEGGTSSLGREAKREVVLVSRLRPMLEKLNADLPAEALDAAVEELTRDRSALSLVEGNREIDKLLRGGVKVTIPDRERGGQRVEVVRVFDWDEATANDFLLVSQFWVSDDLYTKRTDLIGFVNGLPLVLMELKKPGVNVREAFSKNLADYKETIPQLFSLQRLPTGLERGAEQDRQSHRRVGALRRLEEGCSRGGGTRDFTQHSAARHLREGTSVRPRGELYPLLGKQRSSWQAGGTESSIPRSQSSSGGTQELERWPHRRSFGTPKAPARAIPWSSLLRRSFAS